MLFAVPSVTVITSVLVARRRGCERVSRGRKKERGKERRKGTPAGANYHRGKFPNQLSPIIRHLAPRFRFFLTNEPEHSL